MKKTIENDKQFLFFLGEREGFKVLEDNKTTTKQNVRVRLNRNATKKLEH
jgi:hypothetical protein